MVVLQRFNEFLVKVGSWGTILFMAVIAIVSSCLSLKCAELYVGESCCEPAKR